MATQHEAVEVLNMRQWETEQDRQGRGCSDVQRHYC